MPQIGDVLIECQITIGDFEKNHPYGYYKEISQIFVNESIINQEFLSSERLEDLDITLKILVPFTLLVISIASFLLLFISYR